MGWSRLKQDEVAVRRTALLALRRQGVRYDDERVTGPPPSGLGYKSPDIARKDVHRALEAHRDAEAAEVSIYRQLENERLDDELGRLAVLEDKVRKVLGNRHILVNNGRVILDPDTEQPLEDDAIILQAIDRLVKIEDARRRNAERRAKLNGYDMPLQAEITGANGGPLQMSKASDVELEAIMNAGPDPAVSDENTDGPVGDDSG
ncbi:hypothetical protein ADL27_51970 [Streptomyces sp. NRRL F-6602]|nr:hypothetical protein ADL27_51970 [Streptomyces sp. NRRL F-6602]